MNMRMGLIPVALERLYYLHLYGTDHVYIGTSTFTAPTTSTSAPPSPEPKVIHRRRHRLQIVYYIKPYGMRFSSPLRLSFGPRCITSIPK
jgi:hypothetical protein